MFCLVYFLIIGCKYGWIEIFLFKSCGGVVFCFIEKENKINVFFYSICKNMDILSDHKQSFSLKKFFTVNRLVFPQYC